MPKKHHLILAGLVLLGLLVFYNSAAAADYAFRPAVEQRNLSAHYYLGLQSVGDRLVAVGERGLIVYSDDGGTNWQQARVPVSLTLTALHFPNAQHGWAVGHGGVILHSSDRGESWHVQFDGNDVNQAWLTHAETLLGDKEAALQAMTESEAADDQALNEARYALEDAQFDVEDAQAAVDVGPNDPFLDVMFLDEQRGWAIGAYGMVYQTDNGGLEWRLRADALANPDRYHLYSIAKDASQRLFISGELGIIYRSDDAGNRWKALPSPYDGSLFGVVSLGQQRVLSYGLKGSIFISDDLGDSWRQVAADNSSNLLADLRLQEQIIVLAGAAGALLTSTDRGESFTVLRHSSRGVFSALAQTTSGELLLPSQAGFVSIASATPKGARDD